MTATCIVDNYTLLGSRSLYVMERKSKGYATNISTSPQEPTVWEHSVSGHLGSNDLRLSRKMANLLQIYFVLEPCNMLSLVQDVSSGLFFAINITKGLVIACVQIFILLKCSVLRPTGTIIVSCFLGRVQYLIFMYLMEYSRTRTLLLYINEIYSLYISSSAAAQNLPQYMLAYTPRSIKPYTTGWLMNSSQLNVQVKMTKAGSL